MRRRWIYVDGEAYEVNRDYVPEPRNTDRVLWGDRNYDGMDPRFTTRTQHREFMKANNLTTVDDFDSQFRGDEARRIEFRQGKGRDRQRREAVERAIHQLENKRR